MTISLEISVCKVFTYKICSREFSHFTNSRYLDTYYRSSDNQEPTVVMILVTSEMVLQHHLYNTIIREMFMSNFCVKLVLKDFMGHGNPQKLNKPHCVVDKYLCIFCG